ncbi:unnamed protein product [Leptosia nina]|uniref:Uncharacterized protein n=1 Tax=Leptosia nina TaxID=320188 RepID=A0AAV1J1L1_9NEOP
MHFLKTSGSRAPESRGKSIQFSASQLRLVNAEPCIFSIDWRYIITPKPSLWSIPEGPYWTANTSYPTRTRNHKPKHALDTFSLDNALYNGPSMRKRRHLALQLLLITCG